MPAQTSIRTSSQPGAFLEQTIRFLMPFFLGTASDFNAARTEILETMASFGART